MWVDIGSVTPGWNWSEGLLFVLTSRSGCFEAEAQVGLSTKLEATARVVSGRCPGLHPHSRQRLETSRGALGQRTKPLKKGGDGGKCEARGVVTKQNVHTKIYCALKSHACIRASLPCKT